MTFYPPDASVPDELIGEHFILRPLRPAHAKMDFDALMASKELLRRWSQTDWPADDFTLEQNCADLARHEEDHQHRRAFTFTVLDLSGEACLGCVYVVPLARCLNAAEVGAEELEAMGEHDALVQFWIRADRLAEELDRRLLYGLIDWFEQEWAFTGVSHGTWSQDSRQVHLLEESSLEPSHRLSFFGVGDRASSPFLVFGPGREDRLSR